MHWLASQALGRSGKQAGGGGVGKADQSMLVHAAYAVSHRVQQDLLLAVEFLGSALFVGACPHLPQRGGSGLHCGEGRAIFAKAGVAIKFKNGDHLVAHAHRNSRKPSRNAGRTEYAGWGTRNPGCWPKWTGHPSKPAQAGRRHWPN